MSGKSKVNAIAIVDYGMGNLSSVFKALVFLKANPVITHNPKIILNSSKIILPGVGAFGDAMKELRKRKLIQPLREYFKKDGKFLGICLGLQLLFEASEENPGIKGLGILSGRVQRFRTQKVKVPHMGWNHLQKIKKHPVLNKISNKDFFYFVHSYYAIPQKSECFAESTHGDEVFTAITGRGNIIATQFHPEKSQEPGLRLLHNFIRW